MYRLFMVGAGAGAAAAAAAGAWGGRNTVILIVIVLRPLRCRSYARISAVYAPVRLPALPTRAHANLPWPAAPNVNHIFAASILLFEL